MFIYNPFKSHLQDCVVLCVMLSSTGTVFYNSQLNSKPCHLQEYCDDSSMVGWISDGQEEERALVDDFCEVVWEESSVAEY